MRTAIAFLIALVTGSILVSLANTHIILSGLSAVGADISTAARMDAIQRDITGFAPTLLIVLAIGFAIAFPVAGWMSRFLGPAWRRTGYTLAGAVAVMAIMIAVKSFYGAMLDSTITPIASARELSGLLTLSIGGAAAGFLFALLTPAKPA